ncbi:MupA/Atu3671 family FMN-dependent luciferase-like monooxygenase [Streptomyces altiplanensis]
MTRPEPGNNRLSASRLQLLGATLTGPDPAPDSPPLPSAPQPGPDGPPPRPLSFGQERLWLEQQLYDNASGYHVQFAVRLRGDLDVAALAAALDGTVARHSALHSSYRAGDDGVPVQFRSPGTTVGLPTADARGPQDEQRLLAVHAQPAFDLGAAPPLRALLVRHTSSHHVLSLVVHHIAFDGWSVGVFLRDLAELYAARTTGRPPALPDRVLQYDDFAVRQRERHTGAALRPSLDHWLSVLRGAPAAITLHPERPRPAVPSHGAVSRPVRIDGPVFQSLNALVRREGATVFMAVLAAYRLLLSYESGQDDIVVGTPVAGRDTPGAEDAVGCFINLLPLRGDLSGRPSFRDLLLRARDDVLSALAHQELPFQRIVSELRPPRLPGRPPLVQTLLTVDTTPSAAPSAYGLTFETVDTAARTAVYDVELELRAGPAGLTGALTLASDVFDEDDADRLVRTLAAVLEHALADPDRPVAALPPLRKGERRPPAERDDAAEHGVLSPEREFAGQAARTPLATALVHRGRPVTYAELEDRSDRLADALLALGTGPGDRVAVCLDRSPDLPAALLAVLKTGAAYVPVDPSYPVDRVRFVLADASVAAIVTDAAGRARVTGRPGCPVVDVADVGDTAGVPAGTPRPVAAAQDLAYVIHTSGSTGRPKGVMVERRQVANFFAAMDRRIGAAGPDDVWLSVTSVSFDISVLELLWTLARGYTVVLHGGGDAPLLPVHRGQRKMDLSLYSFPADGADDADAAHGAGEHYRLLLEAARFADDHGLTAVWMPERHFHPFGGAYPNPSVAAAAVAAITRRVGIRAGSVVAPLHHPARIAEEWAMVDGLSGGRVGLSFASGWHPRDFVLAPGRFENRQETLRGTLETVRRLWRGETVGFPRGTGGTTGITVRPRPVQPELPCWTTASGNPDTFRSAGALGTHVLTHLLGQDVDGLADRIAAYRAAWRENNAGPSDGHVTLLLHGFLGSADDTVQNQAREPLLRYLRTSQHLSRTTDDPATDGGGTSDEAERALRESVERHLSHTGLFGTPESCLPLVRRLSEAGVDEIAVLIDFGLPTDTVLTGLPHLAELHRLANAATGGAAPGPSPDDESVAGLVARHGVTHLQCTPSLARLLLDEPASRAALGRLRLLAVGGEALPPALAGRLRAAGPGRLLNMYGPTEATVWATTGEVLEADVSAGTVPLGTPVANTRAHVLDAALRPVPPGRPGELYLGGECVARGYLDRPALSAGRFVADPFNVGTRLYRTGDLARRRADGRLEFLGRADQQVKIHGFRVEPGEIEAVLAEHPSVSACAVVARGPSGEQRLAAYYTRVTGAAPSSAKELRDHLAARLPAALVPASLRELETLPLTPGGKADRSALLGLFPGPARETGGPPPAPATGHEPAPAGRAATEEALVKVFADVLGIDALGAHDDFFLHGGDSILAIRAVDRAGRRGLVITPSLLLRNPTAAGLAPHARAAVPSPAGGPGAGPVTGVVPLTPIQRWFTGQNLPEPSHYNHAMLLEAPKPLRTDRLARVAQHLQTHHDALRTRLVEHSPGGWRQIVLTAEEAGPVPVDRIPLTGSGGPDDAAVVEAAGARLQAQLSLQDGPLMRLVHFDGLGKVPDRLLLIVHHLVVDGISGRTLPEDLWSAYLQEESGEPVVLPPRTASFQSWARALTDYAGSPAVAAEADYWLGLPWQDTGRLPVDRVQAEDRETDERCLVVRLDPRRTHRLLHETTGSGRAHIDDVLLTALAGALERWTGHRRTLLDLEGHGREDLFGLDVSRTVGWFTALYPVLLPAGLGTAPADVARTGDVLRAVPHRGIGHGVLRYLSDDPDLRARLAALPQPEVIFNYLGRFDGSLGPFRLLRDPVGPDRGPAGRRSHRLMVSGAVEAGRLRLEWAYNHRVHRAETIRAVAEDFMSRLCEVIESGDSRQKH